MKISIVIPVYNCEKLIAQCIKSIQRQTYTNWELIVVDDQSTDDSYKVVQGYAQEDKRIRVIQQKNQGSGSARNNGISLSTGEYLLFCDADDYFLPRAFDILIEAIQVYQTDLVVAGYKEFKYSNNSIEFCGEKIPKMEHLEDKQVVHERYIDLFDKCLIQAPWAKLYKTDIIKNNHVCFANYRRCQDTVFNIEYIDCIDSLVVISDRVYAYQTPDGDSYIRKFPVDMIDIRLSIDELIKNKLIEWNVYTEEARKILNKVLMIDILVCCRLNFMNNWSQYTQDHEKYIMNLLSKERVKEVIQERDYGFVRNMLCRILNMGNYSIIKITNKLLIIYLNR